MRIKSNFEIPNYYCLKGLNAQSGFSYFQQCGANVTRRLTEFVELRRACSADSAHLRAEGQNQINSKAPVLFDCIFIAGKQN
jgi:hypothetical protein